MLENSLKRFVGCALLVGVIAGCGDRPHAWETQFDGSAGVTAEPLSGSIAILDASLDRLIMLTAPNQLSISARPFRVGKNVSVVRASEDRATLFVLSRGVEIRRNWDDERPSLTVFDGSGDPQLKRPAYQLTDARDALALDPANEWAVAYGGAGVVENPNELILVDLRNMSPLSPPTEGLTPVTLPAYGGKPQGFTFTSELNVPGAAPRRFLVVRRESDVSLVDLSAPAQPAVTVPLPQTSAGGSGSPTNVVYHDRIGDGESGGLIAVQLARDTSVLLLELAAKTDPEHDYSLRTNVVEVHGVASAIDFVQTGAESQHSLKLAALVGTKAVLVDPATTATTEVALPQAFGGITRITRYLDQPPESGDVALLWGNGEKIAFWALGTVEGTPYRSIDAYDISLQVGAVLDVPGEGNGHLKILQSTTGKDFYVLDLNRRQSSPMETLSGLRLHMAPDGQRVWAHASNGQEFARLTLSDLHPISLYAERRIKGVFDIAAANGERAAVVIHAERSSGLGATVLDANNPDTATARFYAGLALGGIQ